MGPPRVFRIRFFAPRQSREHPSALDPIITYESLVQASEIRIAISRALRIAKRDGYKVFRVKSAKDLGPLETS